MGRFATPASTKGAQKLLLRFSISVVCYTAVFSVITQPSSPQTSAENRTTFLSYLADLNSLWFVFLEGVHTTVTHPITALLVGRSVA